MIQTSASPTLDEIFRRISARQPDAVALIDPADKKRVMGTPPARMTYAQADRAISALAAHFGEMGLPAGSVIAVQLPNTIEFSLTMLAAWRAGLVVALLPQLWRHAELTMALNRISARAIVAASRIDGVNHADLAMNAAAEAFSIRYVGGFGNDLPDGMIALDAVMKTTPSPSNGVAQDARKAAIVSFDMTQAGLRAVPRTHTHLIAGGLAILLESQLPQGATTMAALAPCSFAGLTASTVIWLLSGGTLALHHPFDPDVLVAQLGDDLCDALVAPAALVSRISEAGQLATLPSLQHVVGLWRSPEQVATSAAWAQAEIALTDVYLFGEAGLLGARRGRDGAAAPILPGPFGAPRDIPGSTIAGETIVTSHGTLGLRGPMVPMVAYAAHNEGSLEALPDHVDTGYAARRDRTAGTLCITSPPSGIMAVGGYRFRSLDLQEWAKRLANGAMLTALPDRLCGYRLAGRAADNARAREALTGLGQNPLMVEAFRERTDAH